MHSRRVGNLGRRVRAMAPAVALLLAVSSAQATTYYVDASPTGCNGAPCANSNAGTTEATAFATPKGCVDRMQSGDTCLIKNGTYIGSGNDPERPFFNFCERSGLPGTAGANTVVRNYPGHTPKFCHQAGCGNNQASSPVIGVWGPGIGQSNCGYVQFEGLEVDGLMMVYGAHHIRISGNNLHGGSICDGNYANLRLQQASYIHVDRNWIHDMDRDGCTGGTQGLVAFCLRDSLFEYNTVEDDDGSMINGVHDKDTTTNNVYRYNHFIDVGTAFRINNQNHQCGSGNVGQGLEVYGNVLEGGDILPQVRVVSSSFHHNTLIDGGFLFDNTPSDPAWSNATVRDNIVHDSNANWVVSANNWDNIATFNIDYNVYDASGYYRADAYGPDDETYSSLQGWTARLASDECAACDTHSREAVCSFTAGTDTAYHIAPGTTCATVSSTGGEVGAYAVTDCVGRLCNVTSDPWGGSGGSGGGSGGGGSGGGGTGSGEPDPENLCAGAPAAWLLCDGFEDGTLGYWNDDLHTQGGRLGVTANSPRSGSYAARMSHVGGQLNDAWGMHFFGDHPQLDDAGAQIDDLYVRLDARFSNTAAFASTGVKITITAAFVDWAAGTPGPNSWSAYYATLYVDAGGVIKMQKNSKTNGSEVWREFPQNIGSPVIVQSNVWHEIQYRLKLNTPGQSDGVVEYWIDGEKKAQYTDVNFRDSYTARGWNDLLLSNYHINPPVSYMQDWDNVIGSTSQIVVDPNSYPTPAGFHRIDVAPPEN